ncbi:class I SAM-dependent methyltransferase [Halapricum desulfuricans]|uniref:tRNA(Phe) (4-demethylwyosine(37)-C(7)) aminocarboxypropyltransferase n=1 Tax=Halapricum desulfuricans TaxID=2841257 RepID=A0A897N3C3_9EURY|nr:class I SAM-dependent methyltransferase family protein [Halapricum desulfuricans]QSG05803.1 Wybutosine (yW) biosynthesis enzyme, Trm5 methyltransferase [Halapricum desulfuricans]
MTDDRPGDGTDGGDRLAVVVAKPRAQDVIDTLQEEGVYDADRSVTEHGEDAVAIPVTAPPETVSSREVVRQVGEPRLRTLEDHLRERGWSDGEIDAAPGSWAVIGSVVLVEMGDAPRPGEVGDALLTMHGEADTVLSRGPISGTHREPDVEVVAGEGDTRTVHREHGIEYGLDLSAVMFSPGNKAERARMGEIVDADDRVLDMFAGIGYFTLPMADAGAKVIAVEHNPTAFEFLLENAMRNGVTDRVQAYRADNRDVLGEGLDAFGDPPTVDRIVMGYYDATEPDGDGYAYLDPAIEALEPGGIMHVHEATPEQLAFDRPIERIEDAAGAQGRTVEVLDTRRVKGYSEGVAHVVVDARIE